MIDHLIKYGRPFWAGIGEDNAANVAGATQALVDRLFGPKQDAQTSFEQGRRDFKRGLHDTRYESPYGAATAETLGTAAVGWLGGLGTSRAAKALDFMRFLQKLKEPYYVQPIRRSRAQWQNDLQYGRKQFNALRARSPLKRQGTADARINAKVSWRKIKNGNSRDKYDMLQEVPDIYATGDYYGPSALNKIRPDDFKRFHWYQKGNRGIQVGEDDMGRVLYNVNPDVRRFLLEHPQKAKELGIDITKL